MLRSNNILAAAALVGLGLTVTGLSAAPFEGRAYAGAAPAGGDIVAERIGGAFASLPEIEADRAIEAAAGRVQKGDLLARPGCAGEIWPDIATDCLVAADGSPAPDVRLVTIGYQIGESTTVLMRMPAPLMAAR